MEQIKKIAKNLNRYFGVVKFINIAVIAIAIIGTIYILFIANSSDLLNSIYSYSIDWITIEFNESLFTNELSAKIYITILFISACITVFIFLKLITIVRNILNEMIEGNVFKEHMSNHIVELSALCYIYGVFINVIDFIEYRYMIDYSNLLTLLENGKIINTDLSYTFNFNFIVLSAIIYLLSHIFKYGIELQQLSDETL